MSFSLVGTKAVVCFSPGIGFGAAQRLGDWGRQATLIWELAASPLFGSLTSLLGSGSRQ